MPTSLIDAEQLLASGLRGLALNELVDQLVSEEMARSLNAFSQLSDAIEHKRGG
jgi:transaldolase